MITLYIPSMEIDCGSGIHLQVFRTIYGMRTLWCLMCGCPIWIDDAA